MKYELYYWPEIRGRGEFVRLVLEDADCARNGEVLAGDAISYADLAAFQAVEGLTYAFPRAMARMHDRIPRLLALRDRVAQRPRLLRYLTSPRRLPFNEQGIFRHYEELDG